MNKILILLLLISPSLNAQIQFWGKDDIIEKQFEAARKEMKIKTSYSYITNEHWKVEDSTRYNEIIHYNENGQKSAYMKYKTDWVNDKRYYQVIDSVWYTDKGIFKELRRYTPMGNNGYQFSYKTVAKHNAKGKIESISSYTGYKASEPKNTDEYTYDKKGRLINIITYKVKTKKKTYARYFEYDKKENLTTYTGVAILGESEFKSIAKMKYTSNGLLASYEEFYSDNKKKNGATYTYDEQDRCTNRKYLTTSNYEDNLDFHYTGAASAPHRTYLKYPRGRGNKSFSHKYLAYKFEYFE